MWLDKFTIRNLELVSSPHEKAKTLIDVIDKTLSPMGARMLRRWIQLPLKDLKPIEERQDAVSDFVKNEIPVSTNIGAGGQTITRQAPDSGKVRYSG